MIFFFKKASDFANKYNANLLLFIVCFAVPIFFLHMVSYHNYFFRPFFVLISSTAFFSFFFCGFWILYFFGRDKIKSLFLYTLLILTSITIATFSVFAVFKSGNVLQEILFKNSQVVNFTSSVYKQNRPSPTFLIYTTLRFKDDPEKEYEFWYPKLLKEDGTEYEIITLLNSNIILDAIEVK